MPQPAAGRRRILFAFAGLMLAAALSEANFAAADGDMDKVVAGTSHQSRVRQAPGDLGEQQQRQQQQQQVSLSQAFGGQNEQANQASDMKPSRHDTVEPADEQRQQQQQQRKLEMESILSMAKNAAKMGAILSTADEPQQQPDRNGKIRLHLDNASAADSDELRQSMQRLNEDLQRQANSRRQFAAGSTPVQSGAHTPKRMQASGGRDNSSENRQASAANELESGFDSVQHSAKPLAFNEQQVRRLDGQLEQRPENEPDQRAILASDGGPTTLPEADNRHRSTGQPASSFLDEFHVINSLPDALNHHDSGHQQRHHYDQHQHQIGRSSPTASSPAGYLDPKHANIRVVFNNNPQFIIGSSHPAELSGAYGPASLASSLQRRTRQPSSSLMYDDHYNQDESAPSETKVRPCADQQTSRDQPGKGSEQQVSLLDDPVKIDTGGQLPADGSKHTDGQRIVTKASKSRPPPPPTPVEQQPQQQQQQQDEQSPDSPFDQIVKSGVRPPLRMVISVQNKEGDTMKVPINLHGSGMEMPQKTAGKHHQTTTIDVGQQMQIHIEKPTLTKSVQQEQQQQEQQQEEPPPQQQQHKTNQAHDDDTPSGGDIFDSSLAKPFAPKTSKTRPTPMPQQLDRGKSKKSGPPIARPQTKEDCHKQAADDAPPAQQAYAEQPVQQQDEANKSFEQMAAVLPPFGMDPASQADGLAQMMVPQLSQIQNKTFASMLSQFQQALGEQMSKYLNNAARSQPGKQQQEQQQRRQQQQEDEQDDLVVAMMAADMGRRPGAANWAGGQVFQGPNRQQVAMTVIRPPKGTSIQEAVMNHAKEGQTMAILSSRLPDAHSQASLTGAGMHTASNENPDQAARPGVFSVRQRPPSTLSTGQADPATGVDPDGFSSASSTASLDKRAFGELRLPTKWLRARFKRDTGGQPSGVQHLEGEDKLAASKVARRANLTKSSAPQANATLAGRSVLSAAAAASSTKTSAWKARSSTKKQPQTTNSGADKRRPTTTPMKTDRLGRIAVPSARSPGNQAAAGADHFLAAASQHSDVSSSDSSDDEDESDDDDDASGAGSSSDHHHSNDEPAAAASGESGESSAGNTADDGDDGADMSDDFDESNAFDADDEPYNQAAASDRDYSGASSSFEIPSIEIDPNTLKQKGCRTVLREIQEIPMNGLGAVQANGQPGSGFQTSADDQFGSETGHLKGLRVKRQSDGQQGNRNLINSRKVTSIVMTKECHFPNEPSASSEPVGNQPGANRVAAAAGQQVVVSPGSFYGNQDGASQTRPSIMPLKHASELPAYQLIKEAPPVQRQQQQQPAVNFYQQYKLAPATGTGPAQRQQELLASNFYKSPMSSGSQSQRPPVAATVRQQPLVKYQVEPAQSQQVRMDATSTIRRRSVEPTKAHQIESAAAAGAPAAAAGGKRPAHEDGLLSSAASGVVAKKLYKPPSEDDPYHTLSYSSQTGADPDMEQDEDDSVVMGADETPERGHESQRDSARRFPSGTLSERERAALMDPNHDDTDPGQAGSTSAGAEILDRPDPSDEADESDGDLADETRRKPVRSRGPPPSSMERARVPRRGPPESVPAQPRHHYATGYRPPLEPPLRPRYKTTMGGGEPLVGERRHQQALDDEPAQQVAGPGAERPRFGKTFKFEHELSRPKDSQALGAGRRTDQRLAETFNTAEQLRQLKPGLSGFVNTNGRREPVTGGRIAHQVRALATAPLISRRQDMDDDEDEEDDDEGGGRGRNPAVSSSRRSQKSAATEDPDENPDADPELNPHEIHLPAHSKPKKFEKSFAYVHRDLPKKGAKNPDDFVVTYGRGNLQTEHEDYDSDRDNGAHPPSGATDDDQARAASSPALRPLLRMATGDGQRRPPAPQTFGMRHTSPTGPQARPGGGARMAH
jgi:hypothetical protein